MDHGMNYCINSTYPVSIYVKIKQENIGYAGGNNKAKILCNKKIIYRKIYINKKNQKYVIINKQKKLLSKLKLI